MEDTDKASVTAATEEDVHAIGDTVDAMPDRAGRISFFGLWTSVTSCWLKNTKLNGSSI
uniref:Uncharacterized protein n=1 Tax=Callorhinchus milii TaxID=7868 RepID=A0A4W3IAJ3_CALMI